MIIVQISDTHIAGHAEKTYGIAPMADNLLLCVEHINKLKPSPDLVLVTGDISNTGAPEEYTEACKLLNKLQAPYYVIPGNHDNRSNLISTFNKSACSTIHTDNDREYVNYVIENHAVRLIAMDSAKSDNAGGKICKYRAKWLDDRLSEESNKPTIIFMHHPPIKLGVNETDVDGFSGTEILGEVIAKHNHIERILCGHVHIPTFARWKGTVISTAPSIGMQLVLDLTLKQPSRFKLVTPAYQLHHWTNDHILISHLINVNSNKKSYLFE